jgi:hypothetical protein
MTVLFNAHESLLLSLHSGMQAFAHLLEKRLFRLSLLRWRIQLRSARQDFAR